MIDGIQNTRSLSDAEVKADRELCDEINLERLPEQDETPTPDRDRSRISEKAFLPSWNINGYR